MQLDRIEREALGEADLEAIYELDREVALEGTPEDGFYDYESFKVRLVSQPEDWRSAYVIAREAGAPLGFARVGWREAPENRHLAGVAIRVTREARRQGIGRRLLAEVAGVAEESGRTLLMGETTPRRPAGEAFCRALGAEAGLVEHENRLELAGVDRKLIQGWLGRKPGYTLLSLDGAIPPEHHKEAIRVLEVMNDAPRGDLEEEDFHETPDGMARFEAWIAGSGAQIWTVFAQHQESGRFAGFTRVDWHPSMPRVVWQWGTAVDRAHRGHGLGRWMKGTMLDRILRERPAAERIATTNATSNRWMLAINTELGFRPVSNVTHWQVATSRVRYTSAQPASQLE
jgi:GNAT superfamily N-acetyltransferase